MTDTEVLQAVDKAKRSFKSAETKATRKRSLAREKAFSFFGSTDVEQAARANAVRRAQLEFEQDLNAAQAKYRDAMEILRLRAGRWSDLVPTVR